MQLWAAGCFAAQGSDRTDRQLERPLYLGSIGVRRIEFGRKEDRSEHFTDVALTPGERSGNAIDKTWRRIIRNEMAHQLGSNKLRRRRTMRKDVQHHQTIFDSALRRNLVAQNNFFAVI